MCLTLEAALGRPIEDLEDAVLAQLAFGYVKHAGEDSDGARQRAIEELDSLTNSELLSKISLGIKELVELNLLKHIPKGPPTNY